MENQTYVNNVQIDFDPGFALDLHKQFNLTTMVQQSDEGGYPGARKFPKPDDLSDLMTQHLNGHHTYGFSVVNKSKASFLCIDVDAHFQERLPVIISVLEDRDLAKAAIFTNGSAPYKGKVFILLAKPMLQHRAIELVHELLEDCKNRPGFIIPGDEKLKVDIFPTQDTGGVVRIGGRNRDPKRNGQVETFYNLDGSVLTGFDHLQPFADKKGVTAPLTTPNVADWVFQVINTGLKREMEHNTILKILEKMAYQAINSYGYNAGVEKMERWLSQIERSSVEIMEAKDESDKYKLLNPAKATYYCDFAFNTKEFNNNWQAVHLRAVESRRSKVKGYEVIRPTDGLTRMIEHQLHERLTTVSVPVGRLYRLMVDYVRIKGCNRNAFRVDMQTLADLLGVSKAQVSKDIDAASDRGLIQIVEKGTPRSATTRGKANKYKLPSQEEFEAYLLQQDKMFNRPLKSVA